MTEKDFLAICRYYKDEEESPFGPTGLSNRFWTMERHYAKFDGPERHEFWETQGLDMALSLSPLLAPFFEAKGFSLEQKGMLANMVVLYYDHNPMGGVDFIFDYGK